MNNNIKKWISFEKRMATRRETTEKTKSYSDWNNKKYILYLLQSIGIMQILLVCLFISYNSNIS